MTKSSRISAGRVSCAFATPSSPSEAVCTRKPALVKTSWTTFKIVGLSSITRIVPAASGLSWRGVFGVDATQIFFVEPVGLWSHDGVSLTRVVAVPSGATAVFARDVNTTFVTQSDGFLLRFDAPSNLTGVQVGAGG